MRLQGDERCEYCGIQAEVRDHWIPWSYLSHKKKRDYKDNECVPACRECNCMAGGKVFETIEEKRDYIHARIARKYKKLLAMPEWSFDELKDLKGTLKRNISLSLTAKRLIQARLRWPYNFFSEDMITREVWNMLFE